MTTNITIHNVKDLEISKAIHLPTSTFAQFFIIKIDARTGDGEKLSVTYFSDTMFDHKNCLIGLKQLTPDNDDLHRRAWRMAFDFFLLDYDIDFDDPADVIAAVRQDNCTLAIELPTAEVVLLITELAGKTLDGFKWVAGGGQ